MISNLILLFVGATLVLVLVSMFRQRGNPKAGRQQQLASPDLWTGAAKQAAARQPAAAPVPKARRDHDASAREVMAYLRILEERGAVGLTAQVMPVFLRDTSSRLEALRAAVTQKDGDVSHRVAHTIHGSAASVGAAGMVSTCAEVIREVRCHAFDRCDGLIAELTLDFEAIRRAAGAHGTDPRA
jgi:HPt (histidine-containing phosphotransfer) domain-containing protein